MSANVFKYCWVSTETQDPRSARLASIKMGMHSTSMLASFILQQEVTTVSEKIQKVKIFTSIKFDWIFQIILGEFNSTCLQVPSSGQTAT